MDNLLGEQIPVAIIAAHIIEWLKTQPWFPFAKANALWLNRVTAAVTALVTAGAIHYTWADDGGFTFSGNLYTIAHVAWVGVQQYAMQHTIYKVAIAPPPTPILTQAAIKAKEKE